MEEPMDIDSLDNDFDNKENTVHHSNVLPRTPCTEKGYEELDVSELNMKLRYSLTPTSSPMSKSVSVNCPENKLDNGNPNIHVIESCQMTRSLNTTVSSNDTSKLNKTPLRALSTEPIGDNNKSVLQPLVSKGIENVTITVDNVQDDENLSLPSTSSSSLTHTPEAVTPTKELPKEDGGSPIIRGLKSVFSMFRPSQSPIAPTDEKPQNEIIVPDTETQKLFESTPISSHKYKESTLRKSPHKESITFTNDLEKELLWNEDSTIIFSQEKIPIHKLFPEEKPFKFTEKPTEALNDTVEFMDISYNDSALADKTITNNHSIKNITKSEMTFVDSDSEFVDCETTFTKDVSLLEMKKSVQDINEDPVIEGTVKLSEKPEHNDINNESINLDKSNDTIKNENVAECVETNQNVDDANKTYLPEENVQVTCATSQSQIANMICNLNLTSSISENIMTQIVADSNIITDDTKHVEDNTLNNKLSNQTMNLDITINLDFNNHTIPIDRNSTIDILTSIENITEESEECNSTSNHKSIANITDCCKSEYYEKTLPNDIPLPAEDDIDTNVTSHPSSSLNNELELNNVIKLDIPTKQCDTTDESVNPNDTITSTANNPVLISNDHDVTTTILTEEIKKQNDADNLSIQLNEEVKLLSSERPFVVSDNVIECQKPSITEVTDLQICNNITYEPCEDVSSTLPTTQISDESPNFENQSKETSSDDKQTDMQVLDLVSENVNANNISNDIANTNEEEVIISEDNSPYVSLSAPIKEMNCQQVLIGNDEIRTAFDSKPILPECRPSSPKIVSRGNYNFNFDEMDDPFATKTKIRSSLSPEKTNISTDLVEKVSDISQDIEIKVSNKTTKDKRKSQHLKRKTGIHNRTDTTLNASQMSVSDTQENNDLEKTIINQQFSTVADNLNSNEKISETSEPDVNQENISPVGEKIEVVQEQNDIDTKVPTSSEAEVTLTEYTADVSSPPPTDNTLPKNVFNIPEIEDSGFNPFATVLKMRHSPDRSVINDVEEVANESHEDFNCSSSSKATDSKNLTVREINTEDEDTIEGPFLEADELNNIDKISDFDGEKVDMIQFSDINNDEIEENEEGEMFIDAEAFEFLLNQNKPMVADSGKESLFLKFDPLFAKRMSSIQDRKQSSPKKATKQLPPGSSSLDISGIPGPSNVIDMSYEITNNTTFEDKCDESINNTITKPTMAVTPAVNCAVSPRNKTVTPTRSNRRSFTFTSPAIAVIDRLLSMSANNSILGQDSTVVHVSNEQHEAELALTQLRELLAEKEISVHQLKCESNELKYRLETLGSQMSRLEEENYQKLQNINSLNEKLAEKTRDNKNMAVVVEEYERTIASLIAEKEQEKRLREEERTQLIRERDEQTAHLSNMECSFNDLHSKYEKSKGIILAYKVNEDTYRKTIKDFESNFAKVQNNYDLLKQHATSKLNHANQELEKINRAHEAEILKLHTMLKRKEVEITSLEESLAQKTKANDELAAICDELINKTGTFTEVGHLRGVAMTTNDKHCQTSVKQEIIEIRNLVRDNVPGMFDESVPVVNAREIESPPSSGEEEEVKESMSKFNPPVRHTARHDFDSESDSDSEAGKFLDNLSGEDQSPDRKTSEKSFEVQKPTTTRGSKPKPQQKRENSSNSESDSVDLEAERVEPLAGSGRRRGGAGVVVPAEGAYDPKQFQDLKVPPEMENIFQYIMKYTPQKIDIDLKLQPFVPDYVPAVGDIDAFVKVNAPACNVTGQQLDDALLQHIDNLGLSILDEPSSDQSDSALLHLQLRALSKITSNKTTVLAKKVENAEKNPKAIDRWIKDVSELHLSKPPPTVNYTNKMPDIDSLMEEWPEIVEEALNQEGVPPSNIDCSLQQYVELTCGVFDVPIHGDTLNDRIQALHLLFSLYSAVRNSQLYAERQKDKIEEG